MAAGTVAVVAAVAGTAVVVLGGWAAEKDVADERGGSAEAQSGLSCRRIALEAAATCTGWIEEVIGRPV